MVLLQYNMYCHERNPARIKINILEDCSELTGWGSWNWHGEQSKALVICGRFSLIEIFPGFRISYKSFTLGM